MWIKVRIASHSLVLHSRPRSHTHAHFCTNIFGHWYCKRLLSENEDRICEMCTSGWVEDRWACVCIRMLPKEKNDSMISFFWLSIFESSRVDLPETSLPVATSKEYVFIFIVLFCSHTWNSRKLLTYRKCLLASVPVFSLPNDNSNAQSEMGKGETNNEEKRNGLCYCRNF